MFQLGDLKDLKEVALRVYCIMVTVGTSCIELGRVPL